MDVDLLRPGTVPISPDTILWFEFLLKPSLLKEHLSKHFPDPTPTELIIKFMTIINENSKENELKPIEVDLTEVKQPVPTTKWSHKSVALKILSLKVVAYLKWDLDLLEKKLPLPMQLTLLQDLFFIAADSIVEVPDVPDFPLENVSDQVLFTLVLYHRWHLRAIVHRALSNKQNKQQFVHVPGIQEAMFIAPNYIDDVIRKLESQVERSINVLNQVLAIVDLKPRVLSFDTFQMLTENSTEVKQNWEKMQSISAEEFKCQIHYDMAVFYLLKEDYQNAKRHINEARLFFYKLDHKNDLLYCRVQREYLEGCCLACDVPVEGSQPNLTQKLLASIKDQYTNMLEILQLDNVTKEIPLVYRDNLELDIQGGLLNRKIVVARDLLLQIQCLNLIRKVTENDVILGDYPSEIKAAEVKGLQTLFWTIDMVLQKSSPTDSKRIARYLLHLVIRNEITGLAKAIMDIKRYSDLFDDNERAEIEKAALSDEIKIPDLLLTDDWGIPPVTFTRNLKMATFKLEDKLISSYKPEEIRETLIALSSRRRVNEPLYRINNRWELPIPMQSLVAALQDPFLQDFSYILIAKSRELTTLKDFDSAKNLLAVIEDEISRFQQLPNNLRFKLKKLVGWEFLLVDIWHCLFVWPGTNNSSCDFQLTVTKCKECLGTLQNGDQIIPRQEIIEYCIVFLLNMSEWEYLTSLERRWSYAEFAVAISNICIDVTKVNGSGKFPREAWDLVLGIFNSSRDQSQKRSAGSSSGSGGASRDAIASVWTTLNRLREQTAFSVCISLFARLHNVLLEESNLELHTQYISKWPASVPNLNPNVKTVGEYLFQLLTQALKYYPCHVPWLRLMGDLNFVLGYHESAMRYYLQAIMICSDLFSQAIPRVQIDDLVYRRMIKCCAQLNCFTQATVLCQFLEEIDYSLAFKMASSDQKACASADAMDAYYYCIWDTTILEYLIHLHTKRGEHHRKQLAIKEIGLLELNSNNNEEIQREAASTRKAKFLRALAQQYVY